MTEDLCNRFEEHTVLHDDDSEDEYVSPTLPPPKHSLIIECRTCGGLGYYEDIRDDYYGDPDYEYGYCRDCEDNFTHSSEEEKD